MDAATDKGRVLIIDDQRNMRATLAMLLRGNGYEVEAAANGREGKELGAAGAYDLVLTDLRMGELDGIDVLRAIKQAQPLTVGHNAPQLLGGVEVFLEQRVWRKARPSRWRAGVQAGADALDMYGRRVLVLAGAVRDRVGAALDLVGAGVKGQLVAEHIQQRQHPALARDRGGRVAFAQIVDIGFEQHPLAARRLPGRLRPRQTAADNSQFLCHRFILPQAEESSREEPHAKIAEGAKDAKRNTFARFAFFAISA